MTPTIRPFSEATDREAAVELFLQLNRHEFAITGDRRTDRGGAEFCVEDMIQAVEQGAVALVAEIAGRWSGCWSGPPVRTKPIWPKRPGAMAASRIS